MSAPLRVPRWPLALACASAAAAAGCGVRGALYTEPLRPLPLAATASAAVAVVPETQRAVVLSPLDGAVQSLAVSPGARAAVPVPGLARWRMIAEAPSGESDTSSTHFSNG